MELKMTRYAGWFLLWIFVCVSFFGGEALAAAPVASATAEFPDIRLEDQFRSAHSPDSLFNEASTGRPLVIIAGDQRRSDENIRAWVNLLKGTLGDRVRFIGLANLRGLPFFVSKNSVRSSLKKKLPDVLVLCDWKGDGFKQFAFVRGQMNVRVYSRSRALVGSITGTADVERAKAVVALIDGIQMEKSAAP